MSPTDWLERLNQATEYRELQVVFSELAADARTARDGTGLASSIDEAIRRIERESLRDEDELRAFEQEYEAFKQQQAGVVGWFKRHLPFTETRRQEKRHKHTVADQRAEILADNLVIARAQILKEQLLPPGGRRMGHDPATWRRRLAEFDSLAHLPEYASAVRELGSELQQSHAFVKELESDIEGFAEADFSGLEDRQRKKADLRAARDELSGLRAEVDSEESLRSQALRRLGQMVGDDLCASDSTYRRLTERLKLLEVASQKAHEAEKACEQLHAAAKQAGELARELADVQKQQDQLASQARQLRTDADDTERRRLLAAANLAEQTARQEVAKDEVERARAAAEAAKKLYQAYLAETGQCELEPGVSLEDSSPVAAEYVRTQRSLEQVEAHFRIASAPVAAAKKEVKEAEKAARAAGNALDKTRQQEDELTDRQLRLREQLNAAGNRLRTMPRELDSVVAQYLTSLTPLNRESPLQEVVARKAARGRGRHGVPDLLTSPDGGDDFQTAVEHYGRCLKMTQSDGKAIRRDLSEDRQLRQTTWAQRCRELLGDDLAAEVGQYP